MTTMEVFFRNIIKGEYRVPYVCDTETMEYACDGNEGTLYFDGYYNVEDHAPPYLEDMEIDPWRRPVRNTEWLPKTLEIYMKRSEKEPYKTEIEGNKHTLYYHIVEECAYRIEIYKRVLHESTDRISEEVDTDGTPINVCFFPTNKQTIYFRVLETLEQSTVNQHDIDL